MVSKARFIHKKNAFSYIDQPDKSFLCRFSSRSFNSSLSYQSPHDEACVQSDGQEHEDQQYQTRDKEVQRVRRAQFMLKMQSTTKQTEEERGVPLRDVVADCARHSFKDYLKKANNDDVDAQMIVGKMYCAGYGVNKDLQKVCDLCCYC